MCLCLLEDVLETIGKKWDLLVINEIGNQKKLRYNSISSNLKGISPSALAITLKNLEKKGLIQRKAFNEIPPKVEYSLTHQGREFLELVRPLILWAKTEGNVKNCRCKGESNQINIKNRLLRKLIEASMCACTCLPLIAGNFISSNLIF